MFELVMLQSNMNASFIGAYVQKWFEILAAYQQCFRVFEQQAKHPGVSCVIEGNLVRIVRSLPVARLPSWERARVYEFPGLHI